MTDLPWNHRNMKMANFAGACVKKCMCIIIVNAKLSEYVEVSKWFIIHAIYNPYLCMIFVRKDIFF